MKAGDKVILRTPDNTRLDGAVATVAEVTAWGAHCSCDAAATGQFRATFDEMELLAKDRNGSHKTMGYTGSACSHCGSFRMKRTGTCETCEDCGNASGGCA